MAINSSATNAWYEYFMAHSSSHDWILITVFGLRSLWAAIGILFNFCVIFVTIKNKDLHHLCNILIALEAFFAIFLNLNFFFAFAVVVSGLKFVRYEYCFPWLFIPGIFAESAQLTMLLIGIDRLFSVMLPIWYKSKSKLWCFSFASLALFAYALYNSILLYADFVQSKSVLVSCSSNEMIQSGVGVIMRANTIAISLLLMTVYILVWVVSFMVKSSAGNAAAMSENSKHLIKSLIIIIGLDLCCVCIKNITMLLIRMVTSNTMVTSSLSVAFSFLTIAVYSANGPVLYFISTVYRSKFQKHFRLRRNNAVGGAGGKIVTQSQQIVPMTPIMQQKGGGQSRRSSRMIDVSQINPY